MKKSRDIHTLSDKDVNILINFYSVCLNNITNLISEWTKSGVRPQEANVYNIATLETACAFRRKIEYEKVKHMRELERRRSLR